MRDVACVGNAVSGTCRGCWPRRETGIVRVDLDGLIAHLHGVHEEARRVNGLRGGRAGWLAAWFNSHLGGAPMGGCWSRFQQRGCSI